MGRVAAVLLALLLAGCDAAPHIPYARVVSSSPDKFVYVEIKTFCTILIIRSTGRVIRACPQDKEPSP